MGVQDVVARLNKSKSATTTTTTTHQRQSPPPKRKILLTSNHHNENKILPPSPATSPTSSIQKQDNPNNNNNKNIANILQKFGQPPTYTSRPITTPTTTTAITSNATPPESPTAANTQLIKKNVTLKKFDHNKIDVTLTEIEDLYQKLVDQNKAAEEYIEKLQQDVEKFSSDATKVRDYEIRVEYLALKLEQVSEERDMFEKELNELQQQNSNTQQRMVVNAPASPLSLASNYQHDIVIEEEQRLHNQNNDAYMADILNVYEEMSERSEDENGEGDGMQLFDGAETTTEEDHLMDVQSQQQQECDRGMQMAIVKYVTDLETQKLETKALKEVVKKQDELIIKLEAKVKAAETTSEDELLKEQVQVQSIELENKRELLAQLLNEREDLLRRLNSNQRKSRRSSIELISNMLNDNRPASYCSISSGRGTPPLTAPPKQPLPPLPPK